MTHELIMVPIIVLFAIFFAVAIIALVSLFLDGVTHVIENLGKIKSTWKESMR